MAEIVNKETIGDNNGQNSDGKKEEYKYINCICGNQFKVYEPKLDTKVNCPKCLIPYFFLMND